MNRTILLVLLAMAVFVCNASGQANFKKYDIKSGKVTYEQVMNVSSMTVKTKFIVYFDDYGMKECRETWSADNVLSDVYLSDGKDLISINMKKKKATKQGTAYRGTELRVEWTDFGTEKDRQSGKIRKLPAQVIAGKTCEMFESGDPKGSYTRYGGWNKILMLLDSKSSSTQTVRTAVKVEENVPVPADKFKVPAGFSF
jgi:hypothetical protein